MHLSGIYLDYFSSPVFLPFNEFPPLLASPPANIVEQSSSLWGEGGRGPNNYPDGGGVGGGGEGGRIPYETTKTQSPPLVKKLARIRRRDSSPSSRPRRPPPFGKIGHFSLRSEHGNSTGLSRVVVVVAASHRRDTVTVTVSVNYVDGFGSKFRGWQQHPAPPLPSLPD